MSSAVKNKIINLNYLLFILYVIAYLVIVEFFETNEFIFDLKHFFLLFNCLFATFSIVLKYGKGFYKTNKLIGKSVYYVIATSILFLVVSIIRALFVGKLIQLRSFVQISLFLFPMVYVFLLINLFDKEKIIKLLKITTLIFVYFYFTEPRHTILSFFNIDNWLSINLLDSYSFTESHICAEAFFQLFIFFYFTKKYYYKDDRSIKVFYIINLIFAILSFKRLALLFIAAILIMGIFFDYKRAITKKSNFIVTIVFVMLCLVYIHLLTGDIYIGIDMNKLTTNRVWILSLWESSNYYSYGYGTSLFVIGRYLEMDLVQIYFELGIICLFCFSFTFIKMAGKRIYTNLIILYVLANLLTSSTMPWTFGWITLAFNLLLLSSDNLSNQSAVYECLTKSYDKDRELISVIVPIYNVSDYLPNCIETIINQTYENLEILLVNDGSTDNSKDICELYMSKDNRIKLLNKKNGGLSDARNYGLKHAKGDYIIFIDSDDVISDKMIEVLYCTLKSNKADMSIVDLTHFVGNDKPSYFASDEIEIYNPEDAICTMLYQNKFLVSACAKMYKKDLFKNIIFPVGMIFEDNAIMYKVFDKCEKIVYNPSKLYGYRHRNDSITTNKFSKKNFDILKICNQMNNYFKYSSSRINTALNCYTINANFRVYLNGYGYDEFKKEIEESENYIKKNAFKNLTNVLVRPKLKLAILLFVFCKPLMFKIYSKVDRWK